MFLFARQLPRASCQRIDSIRSGRKHRAVMPRARALGVGVGGGVGVRVKKEEDAASPPPASAAAAPAPPSPLQPTQRRQPRSAAVAVKKEMTSGPGASASSRDADARRGVVKRENPVSGTRGERGGRHRAASHSGRRSEDGGGGAGGGSSSSSSSSSKSSVDGSLKREKRKASAGSAGGVAAVEKADAQTKRPKSDVETDGDDDDDADDDAGDDGIDDAKPNAWDAAYWPLLRFVEAHGHARVPHRFADDPALGRWVSTQRQAYAAELERKAGREPQCTTRITAARIKKLQRIGFEWTLVKPNAWDDRFAAMRRFVKKHGHARVPIEFADNPALGRWVSRQRNAYAAELERKAGREPQCKHRITAARIKKLQRIGFEWTL